MRGVAEPFRRDVDGLTGLLILAIVVSNAGLMPTAAAPAAVECLFVVAGYLVTVRLVDACADGRPDLVEVVDRGLRRVVPAMLVVLAATTLLAIVVTPPGELAAFGLDLSASVLLVANIRFADPAFAAGHAREDSLLLHMWLPSALLQLAAIGTAAAAAMHRFAPRSLVLPAVGIAAVLALGLVLLSQPQLERPGYLLTHHHAWSFLAGALAALIALPARLPAWGRQGLAACALVLIGLAVLAPPPNGQSLIGTTALGVAAAVAMLASNAHGPTLAGRLLALPPLRLLGLMAFSLYLWHWPVLVGARLFVGEDMPLVESGLAVGIAFGLGYLSWDLVETPLRREHMKRSWRLLVGGMASAVMVIVGVILTASGGLPERNPQTAQLEESLHRLATRSQRAACLASDAALPPAADCTDGPGAASGGAEVILWGDSQGAHFAPALASLARDMSFSVRQITKPDCPPLLAVAQTGRNAADDVECATFTEAAIEEITRQRTTRLVIIAGLWSRLTDDRPIAGADPGPFTLLADHATASESVADSRRVFARALQSTVSEITSRGVPVLLVGQVPELGFDVVTCVLRARFNERDERACMETDTESALARLAFSNGVIQLIADGSLMIEAYLPAHSICRKGRCKVAHGGTPIYADDRHLNDIGSTLLAGDLASMIAPHLFASSGPMPPQRPSRL
ncbi:acyltransferase family protein [Marinivivus vitaminiproducens]|uniref:acyltransferase family protein n=1 Tax=Marinivivus vitaminiproducens TaxID=3035935 RepID=UPI0027A7E323|nr:acyltransferase family protein [Geminicoccaceae bacterium SCSIO 64248]